MKLLFSEFGPDYSRYLYPYVVWGIPEPGENPGDLYAAGFHPASPNLDRFTLCRHLRVPLAGWNPSSENRRILRKGDGIHAILVPKAEYPIPEPTRSAWLDFAEDRFGPGIMTSQRLEGLLNGRVITHLLVFRDGNDGNREVGTALMYLEPPRMAHYYYAFYDRSHPNRSLGLFLMTEAVRHFRDAGFDRLYLGTCYSERALYKTQFHGIEFFNGVRWSTNLDELKFLVRREAHARHALQEPELLAWNGEIDGLTQHSQFRVSIGDGFTAPASTGSRVESTPT